MQYCSNKRVPHKHHSVLLSLSHCFSGHIHTLHSTCLPPPSPYTLPLSPQWSFFKSKVKQKISKLDKQFGYLHTLDNYMYEIHWETFCIVLFWRSKVFCAFIVYVDTSFIATLPTKQQQGGNHSLSYLLIELHTSLNLLLKFEKTFNIWFSDYWIYFLKANANSKLHSVPYNYHIHSPLSSIYPVICFQGFKKCRRIFGRLLSTWLAKSDMQIIGLNISQPTSTSLPFISQNNTKPAAFYFCFHTPQEDSSNILHAPVICLFDHFSTKHSCKSFW